MRRYGSIHARRTVRWSAFLALNAAVEAAREIKGLIEESVAQVSAGSTLARQTGRTMDGVVNSVHKVSGIIGEISSASREQAQGITAIGVAVQAMDDDTRNSAAMVREAAASAGALKDEAQRLAEVVAVFHLDKGDVWPAVRRGVRPCWPAEAQGLGPACRNGKLSSAGKVGAGAQLR